MIVLKTHLNTSRALHLGKKVTFLRSGPTTSLSFFVENGQRYCNRFAPLIWVSWILLRFLDTGGTKRCEEHIGEKKFWLKDFWLFSVASLKYVLHSGIFSLAACKWLQHWVSLEKLDHFFFQKSWTLPKIRLVYFWKICVIFWNLICVYQALSLDWRTFHFIQNVLKTMLSKFRVCRCTWFWKENLPGSSGDGHK